MSLAASTVATVTPCLTYRNAPAAIEWLCKNFGFEKHAVYPDNEGGIAHCELKFGNGMIMLGSVRDSAYGRLLRQPDEIEGRVTQSICVVTNDPDEIHRRATAAGARILIAIKDEDYGGRSFTCADLEGHVWTFGSYDPWKAV
ncbi:putative glyoxalase superfamily protein PhnB [Povalibacter uvarum]|uniref:Putative glyoxalase superfamily protein PhnB n=1 Tax=Povalibacter uvarum TaxID=732238 RepID=A0A841HQ07_9GAMM|nr:VOC family protein [Povalibacter uvarum]MBB6095277.1 putative glyoxalase superfamily protein PhnB [Povalibacter uvarum]